jgi:hypothetical protein
MAGKRRQPPPFDPYAILNALERERVAYILVGAFARVLVGADEITRGVDLTPSTRSENLERVDRAMGAINAHRLDGSEPNIQATDYRREPVIELATEHGQLKIITEPAGTRGYDDLRRDGERLPIGHGLRPSVASPRDLARMLAALNRAEDMRKLLDMRYIAELEHGLDRGLSIER